MICINLQDLKAIASNLATQSNGNPNYKVEDFYLIFPFFQGKVPQTMVEYYIGLAHSSLSYKQYGEQWNYAMSLYVAHFLTLYLQLSQGLTEDSPVSSIIKNSLAQGLISSKSAGDLSLSYDYSYIDNDLNSWAAWKMTKYGQIFASIAKLIGKPGSLIW